MTIACTESSSVREVENRTCYSYWCRDTRYPKSFVSVIQGQRMDTSVLNELLIKCSDVYIGQHGKVTPNDTVAIVSNATHFIEERYVVRDQSKIRMIASWKWSEVECRTRTSKYERRWSAAPNEISGTTIVMFGRRSILGLLLQPTNASR